MTDDDYDLPRAARDTLVVIAGVSGTAAKELRSGQSLTADLGLDDVGLAIIAGYQQRIAERLHGTPITRPLDPETLRDAQVWQVFAITLAHPGGPMPENAVRELLQDAQSILRGGKG